MLSGLAVLPPSSTEAPLLPPGPLELLRALRRRVTYPRAAPCALGETPDYLNSKQYHRILKRRVQREKQRLRPLRKGPYKHKSRHLHATRRKRGQGGRFLPATDAPPPNPDAPVTTPTQQQVPPRSNASLGTPDVGMGVTETEGQDRGRNANLGNMDRSVTGSGGRALGGRVPGAVRGAGGRSAGRVFLGRDRAPAYVPPRRTRTHTASVMRGLGAALSRAGRRGVEMQLAASTRTTTNPALDPGGNNPHGRRPSPFSTPASTVVSSTLPPVPSNTQAPWLASFSTPLSPPSALPRSHGERPRANQANDQRLPSFSPLPSPPPTTHAPPSQPPWFSAPAPRSNGTCHVPNPRTHTQGEENSQPAPLAAVSPLGDLPALPALPSSHHTHPTHSHPPGENGHEELGRVPVRAAVLAVGRSWEQVGEVPLAHVPLVGDQAIMQRHYAPGTTAEGTVHVRDTGLTATATAGDVDPAGVGHGEGVGGSGVVDDVVTGPKHKGVSTQSRLAPLNLLSDLSTVQHPMKTPREKESRADSARDSTRDERESDSSGSDDYEESSDSEAGE